MEGSAVAVSTWTPAVVFPHEHAFGSDAKRKAYTTAAAIARKKRKSALNRKTSYRIQKLNSNNNRQQQINAATATFVHPDIAGIRKLTDHLREGGGVSVPTETTYETVSVWNEKAAFSYKKRPHVYLPDSSYLESSPFWKLLLEKKTYGIRHEDDKILSTFNECAAVIHRLAPVIWPGPVFVYVQVKHPVPGVSITVSDDDGNCFSTDSVVRHYIKLRSPRHPLAIRMCKEFTVQPPPSSPVMGTPPRGSAPTPMVSPLRLTASVTTVLSAAAAGPPPRKSSPNTTPRRIASCGSFSSAHSTSSTSLVAMTSTAPTDTLVGWPVVSKDNCTYATTARTVPGDGMVLNGEERREILSVPTCEVPMDQVSSIYIDAHSRTLAVHYGKHLPDITFRVKNSPTSATMSNKERVVQALLMKWNIVRLESARAW